MNVKDTKCRTCSYSFLHFDDDMRQTVKFVDFLFILWRKKTFHKQNIPIKWDYDMTWNGYILNYDLVIW